MSLECSYLDMQCPAYLKLKTFMILVSTFQSAVIALKVNMIEITHILFRLQLLRES